MEEQLVLLGAVLATLAVLVLCVPVLGFQLELWRVTRRYDLSREEAALYARELPDVHRAVAQSLGPGASAREVRRMTRESIVAAILRERRRIGRAPLAEAGVATIEEPPPGPAGPGPGVVTREDLARRRRARR